MFKPHFLQILGRVTKKIVFFFYKMPQFEPFGRFGGKLAILAADSSSQQPRETKQRRAKKRQIQTILSSLSRSQAISLAVNAIMAFPTWIR